MNNFLTIAFGFVIAFLVVSIVSKPVMNSNKKITIFPPIRVAGGWIPAFASNAVKIGQ